MTMMMGSVDGDAQNCNAFAVRGGKKREGLCGEGVFLDLVVVAGQDEGEWGDSSTNGDRTMAKTRKSFTFKELKIPVGERLYHAGDPKHTCVVLDDRRGVRYEHGDIKNKGRKISDLTNYVYSVIRNTESRGSFAPLLNWLYEGEILQQRREKLEMAEELIKPPQKIKKHEIVYIISNPSMPGLIKIGHTRDLGQRMYSLSHHTGVPTDFKLEFAGTIKYDIPVESFLHAAFQDKRVNRKKEFFKMSAEHAWDALKKLIDKQVTLDEENGDESDDNE